MVSKAWRGWRKLGELNGGEAAFVGALDNITNLPHIYDIAQCDLTSYYDADTPNPLLLLRRDDDAEKVFAYDSNGDLDTAAIATWLGGSAGYGVTVYDQATVGDDITQAAAASQPLYVPSGQNGKPTLLFDGNDDHLQGAYTTGGPLTQPFMYFVGATLGSGLANNNINYFLAQGDGGAGQRGWLRKQIAGEPDDWSMYAGSELRGGTVDENPNLFGALFNGGSSQLWINNGSIMSGNAGAETPDGFTMGNNWTGGTDGWEGTIDFVLILNADDTQRAAIEAAINSLRSYY